MTTPGPADGQSGVADSPQDALRPAGAPGLRGEVPGITKEQLDKLKLKY